MMNESTKPIIGRKFSRGDRGALCVTWASPFKGPIFPAAKFSLNSWCSPAAIRLVARRGHYREGLPLVH
jgi:hypothetical protein